jgi:hypothetical protein
MTAFDNQAKAMPFPYGELNRIAPFLEGKQSCPDV